MPKAPTKCRNWCFTLNNPIDGDKDSILAWSCKFVKFQLERGENGTPHYQGLVIMANACRLSSMKALNGRAHWETMKSLKGSLAYVEKDDTREDGPWQAGTPPKVSGERTDLMVLRDSIESGDMSVDEIVLADPMVYHQYGRTLHKMEDIILRKKFRTWMTQGVWIYGPTGVGKSHMAFEGYSPETHYVWKDDNGWQDGYVGQEIVVINDFRGSIKYGELLQMVDKYPYTVPRRGREPAPFLARKVIITSSLPPNEVYHSLMANDRMEQLLRRFSLVHLENRVDG